MQKKTVLASAAAALAVAGSVLLAPLAASAHVHVDPVTSVAQGGYALVSVRVPNESDTASTVKVVLDLPTDTPVTYAATEPVPGWTAQVVTTTLPAPVKVGDVTITQAPTQVVWTADAGAGIGDAQFQRFPLSIGPIPDVDSLTLPAHQTYSDGTVVDWNEATPASGEEPEHPAPVVEVGAAASDEGSTTVTVASGDASDASSAESSSSDGDGGLGLGFGIGGLVLGALALVVALVAVFRRPSSGGAAQ